MRSRWTTTALGGGSYGILATRYNGSSGLVGFYCNYRYSGNPAVPYEFFSGFGAMTGGWLERGPPITSTIVDSRAPGNMVDNTVRARRACRCISSEPVESQDSWSGTPLSGGHWAIPWISACRKGCMNGAIDEVQTVFGTAILPGPDQCLLYHTGDRRRRAPLPTNDFRCRLPAARSST